MKTVEGLEYSKSRVLFEIPKHSIGGKNFAKFPAKLPREKRNCATRCKNLIELLTNIQHRNRNHPLSGNNFMQNFWKIPRKKLDKAIGGKISPNPRYFYHVEFGIVY